MSTMQTVLVALVSGSFAGSIVSALITARSQTKLRHRDDTAVAYAAALAGMEEAFHRMRYAFDDQSESHLTESGDDHGAGVRNRLNKVARELTTARAVSLSPALLYATDEIKQDLLEHSRIFAEELIPELSAGQDAEIFAKLDKVHDSILAGMRRHLAELEAGWLVRCWRRVTGPIRRKRGSENG